MSDDEQAIRDLGDTWVRATVAGDLPQILELMDEDVIFLVAGQPPMTGKAAFAKSFEANLQNIRIEPVGEVQEIQILGDWAYCWTRLRVTVTPVREGVPTRLAGDSLSVFRKQADGRWVMFRDANMLAPIPRDPT